MMFKAHLQNKRRLFVHFATQWDDKRKKNVTRTYATFNKPQHLFSMKYTSKINCHTRVWLLLKYLGYIPK